MKAFFGATIIALSVAMPTSDRDRIFADYQRCVDAPNADLAHCYNTYLRGRRINSSDEEVANESVVEAPVNGEPTGRVIEDQGVETYRRTFAEVFPFAAVDFNVSSSRQVDGVGPDLGARENVVTEGSAAHVYAEPDTCMDPCGERQMQIRELRSQIEFLEWRNQQAETLYATVANRLD